MLTQQQQIEAVREKIVCIISSSRREYGLKCANDILSLPEIAILDNDQSALPYSYGTYLIGQQDFNWVFTKLKEARFWRTLDKQLLGGTK